jgi:hypothetical protein
MSKKSIIVQEGSLRERPQLGPKWRATSGFNIIIPGHLLQLFHVFYTVALLQVSGKKQY